MGWGGLGFFAAGLGAGGRELGLEDTGGCSTARYGVTTSKNPTIHQTFLFLTPPHVVERELQHCNTQVSNLSADIMSGLILFVM